MWFNLEARSSRPGTGMELFILRLLSLAWCTSFSPFQFLFPLLVDILEPRPTDHF